MEDKYNIKFYNNIKKFLEVSMKLVYNPKVNGLENLPDNSYILAGNHRSLMDIPLLIACIPDHIHFMAKKELFDNMIVKYVFNRMGAFPVDRNKNDINAAKKALSILKENQVLGIFPEGTRNTTNNIILPFKNGVSNICIKSKCLLVPFGISGEYKRNKLVLNIGKSINMKEIKKEERTEYLENEVKKLILK